MTQESDALTKHKGRFVRWQGITITQFGYAINLILTFATAALGFSIALLRDKEFRELLPPQGGKCLFIFAMFCLAVSIIAGLGCVLNRLCDFRTTAKIARKREKQRGEGQDSTTTDNELVEASEKAGELGKRTWALFWTQVVTFGLGLVVLCIVVVIAYVPKLP